MAETIVNCADPQILNPKVLTPKTLNSKPWPAEGCSSYSGTWQTSAPSLRSAGNIGAFISNLGFRVWGVIWGPSYLDRVLQGLVRRFAGFVMVLSSFIRV